MTDRDEFAKAALIALRACYTLQDSDEFLADIAKTVYRLADAMVAARGEGEKRERTKAVAVEVPEDLKQHLDSIKQWLNYKAQRGQGYKPQGLLALWAVMRKLGPGLPEAIQSSMANNYAGIFHPRSGARGYDASHGGRRVTEHYQEGQGHGQHPGVVSDMAAGDGDVSPF